MSVMRRALGVVGWVAVGILFTVLALETGRAIVLTLWILLGGLWELVDGR